MRAYLVLFDLVALYTNIPHGDSIRLRVACSAACLTVRDLEEKALDEAVVKPLWWFRFMGDIQSLWTGTHNELETFFNYLNTCHDV